MLSLDSGKICFDLPPSRSRIALALADMVSGLRKSWLWFAMAMQDIRLRYRGSLLGPFWLTLSTIVMTVAMGIIYSHILNTALAVYLPYLTIGMVFWQLLSTIMNDACQTFLSMQGVILQMPMPFSIHVYRLVCRNFIILAHNFVIVPAVLIFFGVPVGWGSLILIPALGAIAINAVWVAMLLGMVSARFRDLQPIVTNFVQLLFFVTPIFWFPDTLGRWQLIAELNPFFAAIDIVRAPLLGVAPEPYSWWVMMVTIVLGGGVTFAFFARFRSRIAYWL